MPSVFEYDNYRTFLSDYYSIRKKTDSGYSYARFAKDAGIASPNYLKLVVDEERGLSLDQIHRFARAMSLHGLEYDFFETLVHYNQTTNAETSAFYGRRLQEYRAQVSKSPVKLSVSQISAEWYFPALTLYLDKRPVDRTDFSKIAPKLGVSEFDLNAMTAQLITKGILSVKENKYSMNFSYASFIDKKSSMIAQKGFQLSQLERSLKVYREQYSKETKFTSSTFTIGANSFDSWSKMLYDFLHGLGRASEVESAEKVVQINIQMFSLFDL